MTFHGAPRADRHTMEHVHESPPVMTGPLIVLAIGAVIAGFSLRDWFIGDEWQTYWNGSIVMAANNEVMRRMEELPGLVGWSPTIMGVIGIALAWLMYIRNPLLPNTAGRTVRPDLPIAAQQMVFRRDLRIPVRAAAIGAWRATCGRSATRRSSTACPTGSLTLTAEGSAQVVRLQTGSIAVYAFSMLIGVVVLVSVFLLFR